MWLVMLKSSLGGDRSQEGYPYGTLGKTVKFSSQSKYFLSANSARSQRLQVEARMDHFDISIAYNHAFHWSFEQYLRL